MKEIVLTDKDIVKVDDEDYEWIKQYKLFKIFKGYIGININGKRKLLHRIIMNTPKGMVTDHIDGNILNNQKYNLRNCTLKENAKNRKLQGGTSKFKGLSWRKEYNLWEAYIKLEKKKHLGYFTDEIAAASCYNYYAKLYYKEFAKLNNIIEMTKEEWKKYKKDNTSSKYRGVCWVTKKQKWLAQVWDSSLKRNIVVGFFNDEIEAAIAYNELAIKIKGEKAKLNII